MLKSWVSYSNFCSIFWASRLSIVLLWSSTVCLSNLTFSSRPNLKFRTWMITFDFCIVGLLMLLDSLNLFILSLFNNALVCVIQLHVCKPALLEHVLVWWNFFFLPHISLIILIRHPHDLNLQRLFFKLELFNARLYLWLVARVFQLLLHKLVFQHLELVLCLSAPIGLFF